MNRKEIIIQIPEVSLRPSELLKKRMKTLLAVGLMTVVTFTSIWALGGYRATENALLADGLQRNQVSHLEFELDFYGLTPIYEVEWKYNQQEREADVHGITGQILTQPRNS